MQMSKSRLRDVKTPIGVRKSSVENLGQELNAPPPTPCLERHLPHCGPDNVNTAHKLLLTKINV